MRVLAVLLLASASCWAQPSSGVSLSNGLRVRVAAKIGDGPTEEALTADLAAASGNSIYRIFRDENQLAVFAYELGFELTTDATQVRITATPAGTTFSSKFPAADGGKPTPTLSIMRTFPPQSSGKKVTIDLFDLPPSGKVVDIVTVSLNRGATTRVTGTDAESSLDQLRFSGLSVKVNGKPVSSGSGSSVSGRYVMFYIPERGGYFFAVDPPIALPFLKAGSIDGLRMQFMVDNDSYDCLARTPILVGSGAGEVSVYHDPQYKPKGNWTQSGPVQGAKGQQGFFTAASDSLNWFVTPSEPGATQ